MSVNEGQDDSLSLALATGNDPDQPENNFTSGTAPYVNDTNTNNINSTNASSGTVTTPSNNEAPLAIENETGAPQSVGIQYNTGDASLGADAGSGQAVSQAEVETLFQFFVYDGTELKQISPDGTGADEPYSYVEISAGETQLVHLVLNLTESISQSISEAADASGSGGFASGAEDDVDLLDTARFGIQDTN